MFTCRTRNSCKLRCLCCELLWGWWGVGVGATLSVSLSATMCTVLCTLFGELLAGSFAYEAQYSSLLPLAGLQTNKNNKHHFKLHSETFEQSQNNDHLWSIKFNYPLLKSKFVVLPFWNRFNNFHRCLRFFFFFFRKFICDFYWKS